MAFTPYVTASEVKAYIAFTEATYDTLLGEVVAAVSRQIDEHCQRHFWQDGTGGSPLSRTFAAESWYCVELGEFNDLVSVNALATDDAGDGTFETTWDAADYQLQPVNRPTGRPYTDIEAVGAKSFPVGYYPSARRDRVQVTGVWGWPAVPSPVKQAALIQSARVFKRKDSPEGVSGTDQFGTIRVSGRMDPDVVHLLAPYRLSPVLIV